MLFASLSASRERPGTLAGLFRRELSAGHHQGRSGTCILTPGWHIGLLHGAVHSAIASNVLDLYLPDQGAHPRGAQRSVRRGLAVITADVLLNPAREFAYAPYSKFRQVTTSACDCALV